MPLIRYRIRDIIALHYDRSRCGKTFVRMGEVKPHWYLRGIGRGVGEDIF